MGPVLEEALPGARPRPGLTAAERTLGLAPDPLRRLAALGGDDPAAALRLSRAEAQALVAAHAAKGAPPHEAAWRHGHSRGNRAGAHRRRW